MTDELGAPLGRKNRTRRGLLSGVALYAVPWTRIGLALIAILFLGVIGWIALVDDPTGGRPVAQTPIAAPNAGNAIAETLATQPPAASATGELAGTTIRTTPEGPSIITLGALPAAEGTDPGEPGADGTIAALTEMTAQGPLPRVGASGLAPYEAYARPSVTPATAGGRKLIAIVVNGLGLNAEGTRRAIAALPGPVTLSFVPYGNDLSALTAEARASGHEILLEIPLEPFDYPQNDPGPHTLLVDQPAQANLEKLYWLLTRVGGYAGVVNHMGARFTASAGDFSPVMEEFALRGLAYLDDGSSNRSVAPQLARQNGVPYARIDRQLDANPSREAIEANLAALTATANERGWALGAASALPISIDVLADWAGALDETRYLLVPVSALASTGDP